jgi:hypothetical protein
MPSDGPELYRASIYDEKLDFMRVLADGERARTRKNGAGKANGAQGRNRTTDTAIFSRMLYQLSYLGAARIRSGSAGL